MGKQEDIRAKQSNEIKSRLQVYLDKLRTNFSGEVPEKHRWNPEGYRRYVRREIAATEKRILVL